MIQKYNSVYHKNNIYFHFEMIIIRLSLIEVFVWKDNVYVILDFSLFSLTYIVIVNLFMRIIFPANIQLTYKYHIFPLLKAHKI